MPQENTTTPELSSTPIVRQKLSDQVFDRLWDMIVTGKLSPGDTLPSERVLMEMFGVGRPAVREALQSLANKGLIKISHGERSRVNNLNVGIAFKQVDEIAKLLLTTEPSNLDHLKQLRNILEAGTIRIAAENCTSEDIDDLRDLIKKQQSKLGQAHAFIQVDIAFHVRIAKITSNPLLQGVTQAMLSWLFEYYKPLLHWTGHEDTTLREHERIVDYLEIHNADSAAEMMANHLSRSGSLYTVEPE